MDYHSLKRKELQVLCKKHDLPANGTNLQMADSLKALLKIDEKDRTARLPCLKVSGGTAREGAVKKVRFSLEEEKTEAIEVVLDEEQKRKGSAVWQGSVARAGKTGPCRKSKRSGEKIEEIQDVSGRTTRSRAGMTTETGPSSRPASVSCKKKQKKSETGEKVEVKIVQEEEPSPVEEVTGKEEEEEEEEMAGKVSEVRKTAARPISRKKGKKSGKCKGNKPVSCDVEEEHETREEEISREDKPVTRSLRGRQVLILEDEKRAQKKNLAERQIVTRNSDSKEFLPHKVTDVKEMLADDAIPRKTRRLVQGNEKKDERNEIGKDFAELNAGIGVQSEETRPTDRRVLRNHSGKSGSSEETLTGDEVTGVKRTEPGMGLLQEKEAVIEEAPRRTRRNALRKGVSVPDCEQRETENIEIVGLNKSGKRTRGVSDDVTETRAETGIGLQQEKEEVSKTEEDPRRTRQNASTKGISILENEQRDTETDEVVGKNKSQKPSRNRVSAKEASDREIESRIGIGVDHQEEKAKVCNIEEAPRRTRLVALRTGVFVPENDDGENQNGEPAGKNKSRKRLRGHVSENEPSVKENELRTEIEDESGMVHQAVCEIKESPRRTRRNASKKGAFVAENVERKNENGDSVWKNKSKRQTRGHVLEKASVQEDRTRPGVDPRKDPKIYEEILLEEMKAKSVTQNDETMETEKNPRNKKKRTDRVYKRKSEKHQTDPKKLEEVQIVILVTCDQNKGISDEFGSEVASLESLSKSDCIAINDPSEITEPVRKKVEELVDSEIANPLVEHSDSKILNYVDELPVIVENRNAPMEANNAKLMEQSDDGNEVEDRLVASEVARSPKKANTVFTEIEEEIKSPLLGHSYSSCKATREFGFRTQFGKDHEELLDVAEAREISDTVLDDKEATGVEEIFNIALEKNESDDPEVLEVEGVSGGVVEKRKIDETSPEGLGFTAPEAVEAKEAALTILEVAALENIEGTVSAESKPGDLEVLEVEAVAANVSEIVVERKIDETAPDEFVAPEVVALENIEGTVSEEIEKEPDDLEVLDVEAVAANVSGVVEERKNEEIAAEGLEFAAPEVVEAKEAAAAVSEIVVLENIDETVSEDIEFEHLEAAEAKRMAETTGFEVVEVRKIDETVSGGRESEHPEIVREAVSEEKQCGGKAKEVAGSFSEVVGLENIEGTVSEEIENEPNELEVLDVKAVAANVSEVIVEERKIEEIVPEGLEFAAAEVVESKEAAEPFSDVVVLESIEGTVSEDIEFVHLEAAEAKRIAETTGFEVLEVRKIDETVSGGLESEDPEIVGEAVTEEKKCGGEAKEVAGTFSEVVALENIEETVSEEIENEPNELEVLDVEAVAANASGVVVEERKIQEIAPVGLEFAASEVVEAKEAAATVSEVVALESIEGTASEDIEFEHLEAVKAKQIAETASFEVVEVRKIDETVSGGLESEDPEIVGEAVSEEKQCGGEAKEVAGTVSEVVALENIEGTVSEVVALENIEGTVSEEIENEPNDLEVLDAEAMAANVSGIVVEERKIEEIAPEGLEFAAPEVVEAKEAAAAVSEVVVLESIQGTVSEKIEFEHLEAAEAKQIAETTGFEVVEVIKIDGTVSGGLESGDTEIMGEAVSEEKQCGGEAKEVAGTFSEGVAETSHGDETFSGFEREDPNIEMGEAVSEDIRHRDLDIAEAQEAAATASEVFAKENKMNGAFSEGLNCVDQELDVDETEDSGSQVPEEAGKIASPVAEILECLGGVQIAERRKVGTVLGIDHRYDKEDVNYHLVHETVADDSLQVAAQGEPVFNLFNVVADYSLCKPVTFRDEHEEKKNSHIGENYPGLEEGPLQTAQLLLPTDKNDAGVHAEAKPHQSEDPEILQGREVFESVSKTLPEEIENSKNVFRLESEDPISVVEETISEETEHGDLEAKANEIAATVSEVVTEEKTAETVGGLGCVDAGVEVEEAASEEIKPEEPGILQGKDIFESISKTLPEEIENSKNVFLLESEDPISEVEETISEETECGDLEAKAKVVAATVSEVVTVETETSGTVSQGVEFEDSNIEYETGEIDSVPESNCADEVANARDEETDEICSLEDASKSGKSVPESNCNEEFAEEINAQIIIGSECKKDGAAAVQVVNYNIETDEICTLEFASKISQSVPKSNCGEEVAKARDDEETDEICSLEDVKKISKSVPESNCVEEVAEGTNAPALIGSECKEYGEAQVQMVNSSIEDETDEICSPKEARVVTEYVPEFKCAEEFARARDAGLILWRECVKDAETGIQVGNSNTEEETYETGSARNAGMIVTKEYVKEEKAGFQVDTSTKVDKEIAKICSSEVKETNDYVSETKSVEEFAYAVTITENGYGEDEAKVGIRVVDKIIADRIATIASLSPVATPYDRSKPVLNLLDYQVYVGDEGEAGFQVDISPIVAKEVAEICSPEVRETNESFSEPKSSEEFAFVRTITPNTSIEDEGEADIQVVDEIVANHRIAPIASLSPAALLDEQSKPAFNLLDYQVDEDFCLWQQRVSRYEHEEGFFREPVAEAHETLAETGSKEAEREISSKVAEVTKEISEKVTEKTGTIGTRLGIGFEQAGEEVQIQGVDEIASEELKCKETKVVDGKEVSASGLENLEKETEICEKVTEETDAIGYGEAEEVQIQVVDEVVADCNTNNTDLSHSDTQNYQVFSQIQVVGEVAADHNISDTDLSHSDMQNHQGNKPETDPFSSVEAADSNCDPLLEDDILMVLRELFAESDEFQILPAGDAGLEDQMDQICSLVKSMGISLPVPENSSDDPATSSRPSKKESIRIIENLKTPLKSLQSLKSRLAIEEMKENTPCFVRKSSNRKPEKSPARRKPLENLQTNYAKNDEERFRFFIQG